MTVPGGVSASDRIEVDYRLAGLVPSEAGALARRIAFEQTVELPEALVTDPYVREAVVGRVEDVRSVAGGSDALATVSYSAALASGHLPQLLNLLFGNASFYPGVRLEGLRLPEAVLAAFPGPRFGVPGVRRLLGVHGRPLLATALKPRGLAPDALADLAYRFALGGGDLVKDDQNLVEDLEGFKRRVDACARAVARANDATGRRCLYLPHVSAPHGEIRRHLDFVHAAGLPGVLLCPMVLGLDAARGLADDYSLLLMAHPALTGGYLVGRDHGIAPPVLLGTLFRMAGADLSIFPGYGGRFAFSERECTEVAASLREPLGSLAPAWPCPAGGLGLDDVTRSAPAYGPDTVFLVGGALHGYSARLEEGTRAFLGALREAYPERLSAPPGAGPDEPGRGSSVLPFHPGFEWEGRASTEYKSAAEPLHGGAFRGVRRVELIGRFGEPTSSDLRYFEVEPGGFTSLERHVHTHLIIGARGRGTLVLGNRRQVLDVNDVAFVAPLEPHQLRNDAREPFGFFCIVDHRRDRPMPA